METVVWAIYNDSCKVCGVWTEVINTEGAKYGVCDRCYLIGKDTLQSLYRKFIETGELSFWQKLRLSPIERAAYYHAAEVLKRQRQDRKRLRIWSKFKQKLGE